jgi:hypothetical protein
VEHAVATWADEARPDEEHDSKQDLPLHQLHDSDNDKDDRSHPQHSTTHLGTIPTTQHELRYASSNYPERSRRKHHRGELHAGLHRLHNGYLLASRSQDLHATLRNNKLKRPSAERGILAVAFAS